MKQPERKNPTHPQPFSTLRQGQNLHQQLQQRPLPSIDASLARATGLTVPTVTKALDNLRKLEIVRESTGRRRNRVFVYGRFIGVCVPCSSCIVPIAINALRADPLR